MFNLTYILTVSWDTLCSTFFIINTGGRSQSQLNFPIIDGDNEEEKQLLQLKQIEMTVTLGVERSKTLFETSMNRNIMENLLR